jgi:ABC-2 type transport system ATP-binding protein
MAIINKGRILLQAEPLRAVETMHGSVWERVGAKDELPSLERDHAILSTKLLGGRTVVRVCSDSAPSPEFRAAAPDLQDVYFHVMATEAAP